MQKLVMVVDDSATIRRVVDFVFRMTEFSLVTAASAGQALARVGEINPDLVIIDADMPGQDGYDLARKLRADERTSAWTLLMMVTDAGPDEARLGDTEIDGYVVKPFTCAELLDPVRMLTGVEVRRDVPLSFEQIMATRQFAQKQRTQLDAPKDKPEGGEELSFEAVGEDPLRRVPEAPAPKAVDAPRAPEPARTPEPRTAEPARTPEPRTAEPARTPEPRAADPARGPLPRPLSSAKPAADKPAPSAAAKSIFDRVAEKTSGLPSRQKTPAPPPSPLASSAAPLPPAVASDRPKTPDRPGLPRSRKTPMPDVFAKPRTPAPSERSALGRGEVENGTFSHGEGGAFGAPAAPPTERPSPAPATGKAPLTLEMIEAMDADGESLPTQIGIGASSDTASPFAKAGSTQNAEPPFAAKAPPPAFEAKAPAPPFSTRALPTKDAAPGPPAAPEHSLRRAEPPPHAPPPPASEEPAIDFEDPVTLDGTRNANRLAEAANREHERIAEETHASEAALSEPASAPPETASAADESSTAAQAASPDVSSEVEAEVIEEAPKAEAAAPLPKRSGPAPEAVVVSGIQTNDIDWGSAKKSRGTLVVAAVVACIVIGLIVAFMMKG